MKQRFKIQPAWLDFSIFWGAIVIGLSTATIFQMEIVGYGPLSWVAAVIYLATGLLAVVQLLRTQLVLTEKTVRLERILPSNTVVIPRTEITAVTQHGLTVTLKTQSGAVSFLRFGKMAPLLSALESHPLAMKEGKA